MDDARDIILGKHNPEDPKFDPMKIQLARAFLFSLTSQENSVTSNNISFIKGVQKFGLNNPWPELNY